MDPKPQHPRPHLAAAVGLAAMRSQTRVFVLEPLFLLGPLEWLCVWGGRVVVLFSCDFALTEEE